MKLTRRRLLAGTAAAAAIGSATAARALNPALLVPIIHPPAGGGGGGGGGGGPTGVYITNGVPGGTLPHSASNPDLLAPGIPPNTLANATNSTVGTFLAWINSTTPPIWDGGTQQFGNATRRTNNFNRRHTFLSAYMDVGSPFTGEVFTVSMLPPGWYPINETWPNPKQFFTTVMSVRVANPLTGQFQEFLGDMAPQSASVTDLVYSGAWNEPGVIVNPGGGAVGSRPMSVEIVHGIRGSTGLYSAPVYSVPQFRGATLVHTISPIFEIPWANAAFFTWRNAFANWWQPSVTIEQNNAYNGFASALYLDTTTAIDVSQLQDPGYLVDNNGNALREPLLPNQVQGPAIHLTGNVHTFNNNTEPALLFQNQAFNGVPGFENLNAVVDPTTGATVTIVDIDIIGGMIGVGPVGDAFGGP
jgi:hypothetical protein